MTFPPTYVPLDRRRRRPAAAPEARLRLVCFGFAGGTVTALLSLAEAFPQGIEVWGAEYPGRGLRWQLPLVDRLEPLLDDLLPGLQRLADRPVALLGYSMGAHVAYHLAQRCAPAGVVAVSARAPQHGATDWPRSADLSDDALLERLRGLGGIPAEILAQRTLMQSFLPVIRADLGLCTDMNGRAPVRLRCPLLALQGDADRLLDGIDVARWTELGRPGRSQHRAYPGGHFFHKGQEARVAHDVAGWLASLGCGVHAPAERVEPAAA